MRNRILFGLTLSAAALLPMAGALAHGGGGGGGGGHGGGGGGGHMGGGGHSMGGMGGMRMSSPSMHSYSGASRGISGAQNLSGAQHFNGAQNLSGARTLSGTTNHNSFTHNNFSNNASRGAMQHQVNRLSSSSTNRTLGNNSFVHSQNLKANGANHWTHNGNWNNGNGNWNRHNNFFFFPFFGFGGFGLWPWYYGYGGYGYGYGYPLYGYNYYGYGNGYGTAYASAPVDQTLAPGDQASADNFTEQGEINFKAGKYQEALRDWQHALVDDPKNGGVMLLVAQTLFALGKYDDAAGATQAAMQMLPEDKWGVIGANYAQLYGNIQDYTDQLKALEKARDAKPDSPALHFLLGFHFGYLGYPKHAVKELDQTLNQAPKDLGARKLRDIFAAKWPEAPPAPAKPDDEAGKEAEKEAGKSPQGKPADGTPS